MKTIFFISILFLFTINSKNEIKPHYQEIVGLWELVEMNEEGEYSGTGMLWHFKNDGTCSIEETSSLSSVDNYNYTRSNTNCSNNFTSNIELEYLKIAHKTDFDDQRCYQIVSLRIVDQKKHLTLYSYGSVQPIVLVQRD